MELSRWLGASAPVGSQPAVPSFGWWQAGWTPLSPFLICLLQLSREVDPSSKELQSLSPGNPLEGALMEPRTPCKSMLPAFFSL